MLDNASWWPGKSNPADEMTKGFDLQSMLLHTDTLGFAFIEGGLDIAQHFQEGAGYAR